MDKYNIIILTICKYLDESNNDLKLFLKSKENRYMLLLLAKNFDCLNREIIKRELGVISNRTINNNLKKAEEKILINKYFRDKYFKLEDEIKDSFGNL